MSEQAKCGLCGEPMPEGESMFKFHGYSGNCPKPPLKREVVSIESLASEVTRLKAEHSVCVLIEQERDRQRQFVLERNLEIDRLKAELEKMTKQLDVNIRWVDAVRDQRDHYRALCEKCREALFTFADIQFECNCDLEPCPMSFAKDRARSVLALFDSEPRDEDYKSVPGKNVGTFKLTRIDAKGAGAMTPCECSHGKSWHVPSGANRPGQAQSCRHPFCECEEYKEKP